MSAAETILRAIAERRAFSFTYDGKRRTADPYILGYDDKDTLVLSAVQVSGGSGRGFRSFHVGRLAEVQLTDGRAFGQHPDYNPNDPYFERVLGKV